MDDVKLTDSELYDQLKAAAERFHAARTKLIECENEFRQVYPEACGEYAELEVDAGDKLLGLYARNLDRVRFYVWSDAEHEPPADPVVFGSRTPAPTLPPELLNSSILPPDRLVRNLNELIEVIDGLTVEILECNQKAIRGNDEKCRRLTKQREQLINGIGYSWLNNRQNMRFMVWTDKKYPAPADPVVTASHTPEKEPPPTSEPAVSGGQVFRFSLPFTSNIWRNPLILTRWVMEELIRNDLPGNIAVTLPDYPTLGPVLIEAFYNVAIINSRGVLYAAPLKPFVQL